jgi:hypothetical protein
MKRVRRVLAVCCFLSTLLGASSMALAQEAPSRPASAPAVTPWEAHMGYRGTFVDGPGFSPFSKNDYFPQLTLGASRVVVDSGRFALAAGVSWDYGETDATARGAMTGLALDRFTAPLTMRYTLWRWLQAFVTVAPGVTYASAHVDEASAPASLVKSSWLPSGDASAGVRWAFADTHVGRYPVAFWLTAEGGYGWTAPMQLSMSPDLPSHDPRQTATTDLGSLAMNGGFGRLGVSVSF